MKAIRTLLFLLIILGAASGANAQQPDKKDAVKKLKAADGLFEYQDYNSALKLYKQVYVTDSMNALLNYKIGVCMFNLRNQRQGAARYFMKAKNAGIDEAYYYLGSLYHLDYKFDDAIDAFAKYRNTNQLLSISDSTRKQLVWTSSYAKKMTLNRNNITIDNLGQNINSPFPDYVPLISADESILIFTSRRSNSTGRQLDPNGEYFEDIYISRRSNDGQWPAPVSISKNLNSEGHDACVALSADGEQLIVYKTSEDLASGDLYLSTYNGKDWTIPEMMGSDINMEGTIEASASFAADNSALYFSSDRPGGRGQKDIYRVVKLPDGTWSKATNLGKVINTPYDEDAPFIHPDGKTLFFSSKGHLTMGGYDIFKTEFDEETGTWSTPQNLGFPVNTVDNDIYFVVTTDGQTGYYSSNKPSGFGHTDIYKINMPEQNFGVKAYHGIVMNENNEPLYAKVNIMEEGTKEIISVYRTNKATGKYLMILSPINNYLYSIEVPGYEPVQGKLEFPGQVLRTKMKKLQNN